MVDERVELARAGVVSGDGSHRERAVQWCWWWYVVAGI